MKFTVAVAALFGVAAMAAPRPQNDGSRMVTDQFVVKNTVAKTSLVHDKKVHEITFDFYDLSTSPEQSTTCTLKWKTKHAPRHAFKCADGWVTAEMDYFDDEQNFQFHLNHAYGETCTDCNDQVNDDYSGDVGSCQVEVNEDHMSEPMDEDGSDVARQVKDFVCPVDY